MGSLKVYSVGRLVKYVTESSLKTLRGNIYRSSVRGYSAEEKAAEDTSGDKQLPTTLEECHKQIESLSMEVTTLKQQAKEYESSHTTAILSRLNRGRATLSQNTNVKQLNAAMFRLDKYKRALADGENIRRRMMKQVEDAKSFAIQSFCKDLLDVADTLSAAAESVPERAESNPEGAAAALRSLHDGVRLTRAQLEQVFARHGLVAVSPLREKFDPNLHEALFQQEVEGCEPGTVVAVSKIGYKLHERCVRPALVGVSKG